MPKKQTRLPNAFWLAVGGLTLMAGVLVIGNILSIENEFGREPTCRKMHQEYIDSKNDERFKYNPIIRTIGAYYTLYLDYRCDDLGLDK